MVNQNNFKKVIHNLQYIRDLYDKMFPSAKDYIKFLRERINILDNEDLNSNSYENFNAIKRNIPPKLFYFEERIKKSHDNFFEEDQHFKGVPKLEISVKSDQPNYDICAALSLVEDDEKVIQFSTGFLRVKKSKINVESVYQITMQPTNITLIKGSKLRLSISGAAYPSIGVNPGFDDRYIGAPSINHRIITLSFVLNNSFMKMTPFFIK